MDDFQTPMVEGSLVIEGAGGLMVPLNSKGLLVVDLIQKNNWPVVLVSRHYLGSINHTLLSIEVLKKRNIEIAGIVFVGDENKSTESIIANKGVVDIWGRVPLANEVTREFISAQAKLWTNNEFLKKYKTKI